MRNLKLYLSVLLLLVLSAALPQALSQTPAPTEQLQVSGDFDLAGVKTGMSAAQAIAALSAEPGIDEDDIVSHPRSNDVTGLEETKYLSVDTDNYSLQVRLIDYVPPYNSEQTAGVGSVSMQLKGPDSYNELWDKTLEMQEKFGKPTFSYPQPLKPRSLIGRATIVWATWCSALSKSEPQNCDYNFPYLGSGSESELVLNDNTYSKRLTAYEFANRTHSNFERIKKALLLFFSDRNRFPTEEEGLVELTKKNAGFNTDDNVDQTDSYRNSIKLDFSYLNMEVLYDRHSTLYRYLVNDASVTVASDGINSIDDNCQGDDICMEVSSNQ